MRSFDVMRKLASGTNASTNMMGKMAKLKPIGIDINVG